MPALKPSLWEWSDWSMLLSASCSECNRLPCRSVERTRVVGLGKVKRVVAGKRARS
jgi:hypothetical protein